jgi:hypothetical protein
MDAIFGSGEFWQLSEEKYIVYSFTIISPFPFLKQPFFRKLEKEIHKVPHGSAVVFKPVKCEGVFN